jgi:hypothetical protein
MKEKRRIGGDNGFQTDIEKTDLLRESNNRVDFCPLSFGIVYYLSFYLQLPVTSFGICQLVLLKF